MSRGNTWETHRTSGRSYAVVFRTIHPASNRGFNLYHAIDALCRIQGGSKNPYLKWIDLWALTAQFIDPNVHKIQAVNYFSAFMHWSPARATRHAEYVKALESVGVRATMGRFKEKNAYCKVCESNYTAREEKESDVNIAVHLVSDAYEDKYDQAFLISSDSDLLGPIRFLRGRFPKKRIKVIAPPGRRHSKELWALATHHGAIKEEHMQKCLFPQQKTDASGNVLFVRPTLYDPPV